VDSCWQVVILQSGPRASTQHLMLCGQRTTYDTKETKEEVKNT